MKKSIKTVALCLALAGMGAGYASCDSETVMQVITTVMSMMQGQKTPYAVPSFKAIYYQLDENEKVVANEQYSVYGLTANVTCNSYTSSAIIAITDAKLSDKVTITGLSISGLTFAANASQTEITFDLTDSSSIFGTLKIGDQSYSASNLNLISAKATNSQLQFNADIYFGDDRHAVNYTFTAPLMSYYTANRQ